MQIGSRVEVRNRFDERWSKGFEVAEVGELTDESSGGPQGPARRCRVRVRRRSDNSVLPAWFDESEIREERKRETWWI
jgi:hypothetical protein